MPANTKYLSDSRQRFYKITAAILGGYFVSATFHLMLNCIRPIETYVVLFSGISFFITWVGLMIASFLAKDGIRIWILYLCLSLLFSFFIWLIKA